VKRSIASLIACLTFASSFFATTRQDTIRERQWHLSFLTITQAHQLTKGEGVIVAVVDTGVDAAHPDLRGRVLTGVDLTAEPTATQGHTDDDGHGTAISGIIVANGEALGIAPEGRVLPVRVSTTSTGFNSRLDKGIDWAVDHDAQVICIAAGGANAPSVEASVSRAQSADAVIVAAAGNYPETNAVEFPAAYPGVIAAAGVGRTGEHVALSVEGPQVVLAAPAVDIVTTAPTGPGSTGYVKTSGTSDATAIIAGAAALVRARFPDLSAAEVIHRLTATADDKGLPGRDHQYGFGVLNIVRALTADVPPLNPSVSATPLPTNQASPPDAPVQGGRLVVLFITLAVLTTLVIALVIAARRRNPGAPGS
jgi:type VII secretion-associated serine protease mycosin